MTIRIVSAAMVFGAVVAVQATGGSGQGRASLQEKPQYVADPDGQVVKTAKQTFKVEVLARDIETPWGLAFLPDGRLLVTERPGRIKIIKKGSPPQTVTGLPKVWEKQDGGMLDVEVHPQYARNGWIYLSYAETLPGYVAPPPPPARGTGPARRPTRWPC